MIILVTGACGFIGSAIIEVLRKADNKIIGIGRSDTCTCESLDEYIKCDISSKTAIDDLIKKIPKCDVVVHAAARISFDEFDVNMIQVNCNGTLELGRFAIATGVKQIVYLSGITIIGRPEVVPITEENNVINPPTLYHLTKFIGEKILQLSQFNDIAVCILRLPAPVSPVMPQNRILSLFLHKAIDGVPITLHGKGNRIQNYIDTRDIGKAVLQSINKSKSGLFLISGQSMSNNEVAMLCNEICNSNAGISYTGNKDIEDEYEWVISNEKSRNELGYKPEYSIKDVLLQMKDNLEKRGIK